MKVLKIVLIFLTIILCSPLVARSLPSIKAPTGMQLTVVSDGMVLNGLTVKSYQYTSELTEQAVVDFYRDLWDDEMKDVNSENVRFLSYFDGDFMYVVQINKSELQRSANGVISISDPAKFSNQAPGKGFPKPVNTDIVNDISANDSGKQSRTLVMMNDMNISGNISYFQEKFRKRGWVLSTTNDDSSLGRGLIMNKGSSELNMTFQRIQGRTNIVAVMVEK